jgi:hypothetical protein
MAVRHTRTRHHRSNISINLNSRRINTKRSDLGRDMMDSVSRRVSGRLIGRSNQSHRREIGKQDQSQERRQASDKDDFA